MIFVYQFMIPIQFIFIKIVDIIILYREYYTIPVISKILRHKLYGHVETGNYAFTPDLQPQRARGSEGDAAPALIYGL